MDLSVLLNKDGLKDYPKIVFVVYLSLIMRKILAILTIFILGGLIPTYAQQVDPTQPQYDEFGNPVDRFGNPLDPSTQPKNLKDSTEAEMETLAPKLYMWKIPEKLGIPYRVPADTLYHHFQNSNLDEGIKGHYNHLGNLGSPRMSRIFYERESRDIPLFMQPFSKFYFTPSDLYFTNSNIPYANVSYFSAGNKVNGEDNLKAYFSVNVNKKLAFGFNIDYLYGRGYYKSQNTAFFNGGVFASYHGDKYQAHFVYNNFMLKMAENGGIIDDRYITAPEDMAEGKQEYESQNIPTHLTEAWNRNNNFYIYYNHKYNLGFTRETKIVQQPTDSIQIEGDEELEDAINQPKDSIITEFVPVTSFFHQIKLERTRHKFITKNEPEDFFENTYINFDERISDDLTTYMGLHNTFGISLTEGFNKYAKAGLSAFVTHKVNKYNLLTKDSTREAKYTESQLYLGGELARRQGKLLNYRVIGEFGLSKNYVGTFKVDGDIDFNIKIKQDTLALKGFVSVSNLRPNFYMRHYHSNHFYWDEGKNGMPKFDKEFKQKIGGALSFPKWRTNLQVHIENLKNYTYFGEKATPLQNEDNIQVIGATLEQNFKLGIFHLDNEVTWQKSSKENIIPVPQLSLYHNLYLETKLAKKILTLQLGADVRYFSKYKALSYMPGVQQFHLQPEETAVEIGGYPMINLYANIHLKKTRIYAMLYHVNQGMGDSNYFLAPHYPINPRLFKIGISWNFYD